MTHHSEYGRSRAPVLLMGCLVVVGAILAGCGGGVPGGGLNATSAIGAAATGKIAFASTRGGHDEIFVMNADGKSQKQLTRNTGDDYDPFWCPVP